MDSRNFDDIIIIFKERIKYLLRSAKSTKTTFYENTCSYESSYENTVLIIGKHNLNNKYLVSYYRHVLET